MKKNFRSMRLFLCGMLVLSLLVATPAVFGKEQKIVFKFSATFPPIGAQAEGAAILGKLLEKHSNGRIEFKLYASSQLGDKLPSCEGLRAGTIEMTELAASDLSNFDKMWSVFSLPFTFENGEDAIKAVNKPVVAKILNGSAEAMGFKIIGWWNMGERSILNNRRPVRKPEDLKGLKIRVMQDPILAKAIGAMGAVGTPMAWSEVYTAVQQRVIDGLENNPPVITANKLYEVAKYYSLTQQFVIPDPLLVSKKVYDSLPADLQKAVMAAGQDCQKQFNALWAKFVADEMKTLKSAGVKVNTVDKKAFRTVVRPMVEDYLKNADKTSRDLYDAFRAR
jgi:tripartite ATP-independent transporter DctP family solute receptor